MDAVFQSRKRITNCRVYISERKNLLLLWKGSVYYCLGENDHLLNQANHALLFKSNENSKEIINESRKNGDHYLEEGEIDEDYVSEDDKINDILK